MGEDRFSIVVKGTADEAARAAIAHGAIIVSVHATLAAEACLIVESPLANLQEWVAEDRHAPHPAGALLYFRDLKVSAPPASFPGADHFPR